VVKKLTVTAAGVIDGADFSSASFDCGRASGFDAVTECWLRPDGINGLDVVACGASAGSSSRS
jgi:hypothetical protein